MPLQKSLEVSDEVLKETTAPVAETIKEVPVLQTTNVAVSEPIKSPIQDVEIKKEEPVAVLVKESNIIAPEDPADDANVCIACQ
jgi:hypothetical protein